MNQQTRCRLCHGWIATGNRFCGACGEPVAAPLPKPAAAPPANPMRRFWGWTIAALIVTFLLANARLSYRTDSDCVRMPNGSCGALVPGTAFPVGGHVYAVWRDSDGVEWIRNDTRTGWVRADGTP